MISAPLGMGFPLSAHVLGNRLVILFGSFLVMVWFGLVVLGVEPSGLWLGDLPRFVLCDDCLVSRPDSVGKSESQIMAKVSVEGCKEIAEFHDCSRCHVFLFGWLVGCCLLATTQH
jgi:hypothetical protein